MKKSKMALSEDIVKYIFSGTEPSCALGEDGYIVYDFKRLYPAKLGIFIPSEVDHSNYNAIFPKSFESYFKNIDKEVAYISRLLEISITPNLPGLDIECISGSVLRRKDNNYTIFRFDSLVEPSRRTELLCRVNANRLTACDKVHILNTNPLFTAEAGDLGGTDYLYWIMSISKLFWEGSEILAAIFAYAQSLREKKNIGPP